MKKIISLISVVVISLTAFCIPAFASESSKITFADSSADRPIFKYEKANISTPNGVPDYTLVDLPLEPYEFQYIHLSGYGMFKTFNFQFGVNDSEIFLYSGNILKFSLEDIYTENFCDMDNRAYVKFRYRVKTAKGWQAWTDEGVSLSYNRDEQGEFLINVDFFLDVTGLDVGDIQFELGIYSYNDIYFNYPAVVFPQYATNFYNGSSSSPEAPKYNSNNGTIDKADNLKDQEDKLMEDTEQGKEETLSLFQNFGKYLDEFAIPLLAIKGLFDYLVGGTIFEGVLLISLTLGLLSFVFNIFPSIQARQNRERQAEAQRTKNAQYNAMMNKLNNQNKGGG